MMVYLLRHGEAFDVGERDIGSDEERMLTPRGEAQSRRAGKMLTLLDEEPELVLVSPLRRAGETAKYAGKELKSRPRTVETAALSPSGSVGDVARELGEYRVGSVLLVGHEPLLGELVQFFLNGVDSPPVALSKGALACVELDEGEEGRGKLRWLLSSRVMKTILKETAEG